MGGERQLQAPCRPRCARRLAFVFRRRSASSYGISGLPTTTTTGWIVVGAATRPARACLLGGRLRYSTRARYVRGRSFGADFHRIGVGTTCLVVVPDVRVHRTRGRVPLATCPARSAPLLLLLEGGYHRPPHQSHSFAYFVVLAKVIVLPRRHSWQPELHARTCSSAYPRGDRRRLLRHRSSTFLLLAFSRPRRATPARRRAHLGVAPCAILGLGVAVFGGIVSNPCVDSAPAPPAFARVRLVGLAARRPSVLFSRY